VSSTEAATGVTADQEWVRLARGAAGRGDEDADIEIIRELLCFDLAGSPYALPVERVREIVRLREITPMPRVPRSVLGVVALRGEIVQVVDLRMCLGVTVSDPTRRSRIIVLHGDDQRVTGVLVDSVNEVLRVMEDQIRPSTSGDVGSVEELCARGDEFVSILTIDRVLETHAR